MAIKTELYMMTQEELLLHIKEMLEEKDIEYNEDTYGNIWSFRFEGKPAFVAHCDTVIGHDKNYKVPVVMSKGRLSRPGHVLGADDRAGVNLIVNHIEHINFVLTKDEEIGCVGVKHLSGHEPFISDCSKINFWIELDRRGKNDIIGSKHGYCDAELSDEISAILKYKDTCGVYTDIDYMIDITQGVNLSVGYYNAHSNNEYLVIKEFEYINNKIIELSQIEGHRKPAEKKSYFNYGGFNVDEWLRSSTAKSNNRKSYAYGDWCDVCNKFSADGDYYGYQYICDDCIAENNSINESARKCDVCGEPILSGEMHYSIPSFEMHVCSDCIKKVVSY